MIVLEIDEPTPSLNRMLGEHWAKKHAMRKRWGWLVRAARLKAKVYDRPKYPRATVTIERYGGRKLDADNCRAGTKFLTDSLKQEEFIEDDAPENIGEPEIHQIVSKTERKTVVRIEGLCDTAI